MTLLLKKKSSSEIVPVPNFIQGLSSAFTCTCYALKERGVPRYRPRRGEMEKKMREREEGEGGRERDRQTETEMGNMLFLN